MEINFNGTIMFTDPWLTGPAFARGWWFEIKTISTLIILTIVLECPSRLPNQIFTWLLYLYVNPEVLFYPQFTYFTHACMEINFNGTIMFTDPWLTGPAFARGWWLMHEPPADWLDRLEKADFIYISHLHSDHLR